MQFNKRDLGKIKAWIAKLQKGGLGAPGNLQDPFGLSATQLDLLRKQMAVHVDANAKDKQRDQVIDRLLANQNFSVAMDARMRQKAAQGGGRFSGVRRVGNRYSVSCDPAACWIGFAAR